MLRFLRKLFLLRALRKWDREALEANQAGMFCRYQHAIEQRDKIIEKL